MFVISINCFLYHIWLCINLRTIYQETKVTKRRVILIEEFIELQKHGLFFQQSYGSEKNLYSLMIKIKLKLSNISV